MDDPINNITIDKYETPGNRVKKLCEFVLRKKEEPQFYKTVISLSAEVYTVIRSNPVAKSSGRELMWKDIHRLIQRMK